MVTMVSIYRVDRLRTKQDEMYMCTCFVYLCLKVLPLHSRRCIVYDFQFVVMHIHFYGSHVVMHGGDMISPSHQRTVFDIHPGNWTTASPTCMYPVPISWFFFMGAVVYTDEDTAGPIYEGLWGVQMKGLRWSSLAWVEYFYPQIKQCFLQHCLCCGKRCRYHFSFSTFISKVFCTRPTEFSLGF